MNARDVEMLFRDWQATWREMEDWVKSTRAAPTYTKSLLTELLPESHAKKLLDLSHFHDHALQAYIDGLRELRGVPPTNLTPAVHQDRKLTLTVRETATLLGISASSTYEAI